MSIAAERAFYRLDLADALRSRWVSFTTTAYAGVFGLFIWLGLRESSILGFTGLSRVVLNVSHAVVLVLPLIALIASCQVLVSGRSSGYFELFLTQPCRRRQWFRAVIASRITILLAPLLLLMLSAVIASRIAGEEALEPLVFRTAAVTAALAWAYLGLGLLISAMVRTPERAIVYALLLWLMGSALHDFALIGLLLQFRIAPAVVFGLAAMNPMEAARLGILSGIDPELSVFGPVGFWLANTLGPARMLALGVGFPLLLGTAALWLADRRLRRADLVA